MRNKLQFGAILLLTFFLFLPELRYALVYDDLVQIADNKRLTAWSYLPGYFTTHLWAHHSWANRIYYRPVFLVWLRLADATLGAPAPIWHLFSIAAHLAVTVCVFLLLRQLIGDFKGAALAAALFAVHPIHTEAVAWISSSSDLLLTAFLVLCVFSYIRRKGPISWLSIAFAALAMFTKEAGIVAVAVILAYEWIHSNLKNALVSAAPYMLPAIFYLGLRLNALGGVGASADANMSAGAMVLAWPRLLACYALHLLWPVHLSAMYDLPAVEAFWPPLLLLAVATGVVWLLRGSSASTRFGAAWFAITFLPALAIGYVTPNDYVHDRYLYLPSVGLALMAAVGLSRIRFAVPQTVAACILAAALCWQTHANLEVWRDDVSLFSRAVETAPGNPAAKNNLAYAYLNAHRPAEALPLLQDLLQRDPRSYNANYNMGRYYQQTGNQQAADYYFSICRQLFGQ